MSEPFWMKIRSFLRVARVYWFGPDEFRWGLVTLALMNTKYGNGADPWEHGVQVTLWLMPNSSRFGSAGATEPLNEDGTGTLGAQQHPWSIPSPTTGSDSSSEVTWLKAP